MVLPRGNKSRLRNIRPTISTELEGVGTTHFQYTGSGVRERGCCSPKGLQGRMNGYKYRIVRIKVIGHKNAYSDHLKQRFTSNWHLNYQENKYFLWKSFIDWKLTVIKLNVKILTIRGYQNFFHHQQNFLIKKLYCNRFLGKKQLYKLQNINIYMKIP